VKRRVLCIFPRYAASFGTFEHAYALCGRTRAFMPPQGILVIAAAVPPDWEVRFVDENIAPAGAADLAWAEVVFVSGMHVQRHAIADINRRAHRHGRTTVLGGPSVSACPDWYREFDYLHLGELGDATQELFAQLAADASRPGEQRRFQTRERTALTDFPVPAYRLAQLPRYFLGSIQFSSGCPYRCEFCDIPQLYGRVPRLKSSAQICQELDTLLEQGILGAVYFVDDNFIGNRRATRELLPALIQWQRRRGYPFQLNCEATLNIARDPDILAMMREAGFTTVFCGIETPELEALRAMDKGHNAMVPLYESVERLNSYGLEVVSGIILGLDTDTPDTPERIREFIERSHIPMLTVNLLQALPRTPLHSRLSAEGRVDDDPQRHSNVVFRQPYDQVVGGWKRLIEQVYEPTALYRRFAHNVRHTYSRRLQLPPRTLRSLSWREVRFSLRLLFNLTLRVGVLADYRRTFWRMAWPLLRAGRLPDAVHVGLVAHHLITFTREASRGRHNASFYSARARLSDSAALS
jgi:hopanoid C-2 methylase